MELNLGNLEEYCHHLTLKLNSPSEHDTAEKAAKLLKQIKDAAEAVKNYSTALNKMKERTAREIVPERFNQLGVTSITVDGYRYTVSSAIRANIHSGMKEEAFGWLREHDLGDLVIETVNASTLSSAAKQMVEEQGLGLDEDFFNVYYLDNTSVTKV